MRPAPSAARTANSWRRAAPRASDRCATLAQAISMSSSTAPSTTSSGRRTSPTISSRRGRASSPHVTVVWLYAIRKRRSKARRDRLEVDPGLLQRRRCAPSRDEAEVLVPALLAAIVLPGVRDPQLAAFAEEPDGSVRKANRGRHDADHGAQPAADGDAATDDAGVTAEPPHP